MKSCLIIGAAPCGDPSYLKLLKADYVICADGGLRLAEAAGVQPDAWIGDCDSLGDIPSCKQTLLLPCEKDYTDLHCAVTHALENGYQKIYIGAATGGRGDHFLANLYLLEYILDQGAYGEVVDEQNRFFVHSGGVMHLARDPEYRYVSLLPLDKTLQGVTLRGLKYPLDHAVIERNNPIGVSNEPIAEEFSVEIGSGRALIILSRDVKS